MTTEPAPPAPSAANPVLVIQLPTGDDPRTYYRFWCPACDALHQITDDWEWDANTEAPTFAPSILVTGGPHNITCHSFIRAGAWQYLADCSHPSSCLTVPMVPVPDWVAAEIA